MRTELKQSRALRFLGCVAMLLLASVGLPLCAQSTEPVDTIRVNSNLVDLKVSVVSLNSQPTSPELQQKDFQVYEDGSLQEISFFAASDTPFDLVLLLDLSGSAQDKINLIRRSAKRFVEATRAFDRVAVVGFTDEVKVISGLTWDREHLKQSIDDMEKPVGGTRFWDALRLVLETTTDSNSPARRRAIVVMTDGVDNALPEVYGDGSVTTFDELLRMVRQTDVMVFPVYLNTEPEEAKRHRTPRSAFAIARDQLDKLALASGTAIYTANKLKDLDRVYGQVIRDLGTVYSIGYKPTNELRDGKWRNVMVRIVDRQELAIRAKNGYFAKSETQSMRQ